MRRAARFSFFTRSVPDGVPSGKVPPGLGPESSVTYYRSSTDNGQTWNAPVNINSQVKDPAWAELDTGPGAGIQLRWQSDPARNGRIISSPYVRLSPTPSFDFQDAAIYSDDHGATWSHGSIAASTKDADEAQIVELTNGDLLMDARQQTAATTARVGSATTAGPPGAPSTPAIFPSAPSIAA